MTTTSSVSSVLGNTYWVLRHGKSIPNEKGIIISTMENGVLSEYRLTTEGINQAELAGESFQVWLKEHNIPIENVRIFYSPFSRTKQTAEIVASVLHLPFESSPQCKAMVEFRERFFGPSFEFKDHNNIADIWDQDEKDPFLRPEEGGESAADVASRLGNAVQTMEKELHGCVVMVVSHGDPLQILQAVLHGINEYKGPAEDDFKSRVEAIKIHSTLSHHRQKFALLNGELRQVM
ncbi:hypothetical protein MKX01_005684 [Papaver californicum]|nr:hypothetical protein MKX01_005684 [Papaver californicum]